MVQEIKIINSRSNFVPLRGKKLGKAGERQEEMMAIVYWYYYPYLSLLFQHMRLRIWMLGVRVSPPAPVIPTDCVNLIPLKLLNCATFVPLSIKLGTNSPQSDTLHDLPSEFHKI